jgi:hypothetical protein
MSNTFGTDILIQAKDPMKAARFYVKELGFETTDETPNLVSLHGKNINLFIERGPALGPVSKLPHLCTNLVQRCHSSYFSTTVIVGLVLLLLMNTSLFPEIRIAVVPLPTFPTPFAGKE